MNSEEIFMKHFKSGMKNKDLESFKRDYPTLFKCIISSIDEASSISEESKKNLAMNSWYSCMIAMGAVPLSEELYFEARTRFMDIHGMDEVPSNLDYHEKFSDIDAKNCEIRYNQNKHRPSGN
jgi:hypothetical protein